MVVFPAPSRPRIKTLNSFSPQIELKIREKIAPEGKVVSRTHRKDSAESKILANLFFNEMMPGGCFNLSDVFRLNLSRTISFALSNNRCLYTKFSTSSEPVINDRNDKLFLPLHLINLVERFKGCDWVKEHKDSSGHRTNPLPFINRTGLLFINGYRQVLYSKMKSLSLDFEIPLTSSVNQSITSPSEQTKITLGYWLSLLASGSSLISGTSSSQYISQALNIELFLSSLKQSESYSQSLEPMGLPSSSDLHDLPQFIPENVIQAIGGNFGSIEEFKKTVPSFEHVGLAFFGASAWMWLVQNRKDQLKIIITLQAGSPFIFDPSDTKYPIQWPILGLSLWEHAYMPTHSINKEAYLTSFWNALDWSTVLSRLGCKFLKERKIETITTN